MGKVYTIEGNTSGGSTLVANGGGVAAKSYDSSYSRIAKIWRPMYKYGEAKKVVAMATKYIGYLEKKTNSNLESFTANAGYNNYTIFAKMYNDYTHINVQGQPWCDVFVDMMFILALGVNRAKELLGGFSAYTPTSSNLLKGASKKEVKDFDNAKAGDIIFFKNSERICHTGIIRKNDNIKADNTNHSQPDSVTSSYNQAKFKAEMRKYAGSNDDYVTLAATVTLSKTRNKSHAQVLFVQKYLKYLGYYNGVPDRVFGSKTENAVNKFQKEVLKYKKPDGEITAKGSMWREMLGIPRR